MAPRPSLGRNLVSVFAGQLGTWALTSVLFLVIPRYLGAEDAGAMSIGWTFGGIVTMVAGLGMATLLTREVARSPESAGETLSTAFAVQFVLAIFVGTAAVLAGLILRLSSDALLAVAISSAAAPFVLTSLTAVAAFQGLERMQTTAAYDVTAKALGLTLVMGAVVLDLGLIAVLVGFNLGIVAIACMQFRHIRRTIPFRLPSASPARAQLLTHQSLPFFVITIIFSVYGAIDILLLTVFAAERDAGIYSGPMRILGTLLFVPATIATVTFPRLSALVDSDRAEFLGLSGKALLFGATASAGLALAAMATGDEILVSVLGGEFEDSGPVMVALAVVIIPTAFSTVAARVAFAVGRQGRVSVIGVCSLVAKVAVGVLLVPLFAERYGNAALGAATSLAVTEWLMAVAMGLSLPRDVWSRELAGRMFGLAFAFLVSLGMLGVFMPLTGGWVAGALSVMVFSMGIVALGVHPIAETVGYVRAALHRPERDLLS